MIIKRTIDKKDISEMSRVSFPGIIHVVQTPQEAERAVTFLNRYKELGIDSETRPAFRRGEHHQVALLQIASHEHCFLFRLHKIGLTLPVIKLLESKAVTKIGLSLKDDIRALHFRAPFEPGAWIELQEYVRPFGIKDMSLQKIYGILFNEKISKSQRLSNWEADDMSPAQQEYAAIDAWACLKIFDKLKELKKDGDFEIEPESPKEDLPVEAK